jgi:hypothetical protein
MLTLAYELIWVKAYKKHEQIKDERNSKNIQS